MSGRVVKIGGGGGFVTDGSLGIQQFLAAGDLDYIIFDYLGEGSLAWLAADEVARPGSGFSPNLVDVHLGPHMAEIMAQGVKIVTSAGGMNPRGAADALRKAAAALGLAPKIAVVEGDDVRWMIEGLRADHREFYSGEALPEGVTSANAYLGAFPIAAALGMGADIVLTGRVVDSALALGPLIHEFGWKPDDYDALAGGTAAGHVIECGAQASGGTFTDWRDVEGWEDIGYPIVECEADGSFVVAKPEGSGGLVSVGTVSEQMLYEIQDPQAYMVADVACDFGAATVEQVGEHRVRVANVRGGPPSSTYKVSATFDDGWRCTVSWAILGLEAGPKGRRTGEAIIARTRTMLRQRNLPDWTETLVEVLGAETTFGDHAIAYPNRESVCRMVVRHPDKAACELFGREVRSLATNMATGSAALGASVVAPVLKLFSFLLEKDKVKATVTLDDHTEEVPVVATGGFRPEAVVRPAAPSTPDPATLTETVPVIGLAWCRSGDKQDMFNVGVIARNPEYLRYLRAALTEEAVGLWFRHVFADPDRRVVGRYDLPGLNALNFTVENALQGGITTAMRVDLNGKGMSQQLCTFPVPVTPAVAAEARADMARRKLELPRLAYAS